MTLRCTVCANPTARRMIDASLDEGMTAAGISRHLEGIGATVSAEVIARHRKHYADDRPLAPKGTRKQDLAVIVRDKVLDKLDTEDGDAVEAMLFSKAGQGAIAVGLKAQNILDTREKMKAKTGQTLELLAGLRAILTGGIAPVALLEDPNVIEGEAVEVDGEAD